MLRTVAGLVAAAALIAAGLWLLRSPPPSPTRGEASTPPAPVPTTGPPRSHFLAGLPAPRPGDAERFERGLARLRSALADLGAVDLAARTRRVLRDGRDLEARFDLALRREAEGWSGTLAVPRETGAVRYRGRWRAGRLAITSEPGEGDPPSAGRVPTRMLPIGIGDVSAPDLVALGDALVAGRARVVAASERGGRTELVIELDLVGPQTPEAPSSPVAGWTALAVLDATSLEPRTLRVFDPKGELTRVYSDLAFDREGPFWRPRELRAESLANASHTWMWIETFRADPRAAGPTAH